MSGSSSLHVTTLLSLVALGFVVVEHNAFSLSRDHVIKALYMWESLMVSHHPAKFSGQRHCGSEDIMILVCHMIQQDHAT